MKITFIRHAESHNNYLNFLYRNDIDYDLDPPLSELGRRQAAALAEFLESHRQEFNFDRIFISPFLRTLQTADAFSHLYPDFPKTVWMWIHEGGGCFEIESDEPRVTVGNPGMKRSEINAQFPQFSVSEEITEKGWYFLPEVEPYSHEYYRAFYVVDHLVHAYGETDEHIALVSHGNFFNHLVSAIFQGTLKRDRWFTINNTALAQFRYTADASYLPGWWRIEFLNRHEWLHGKDLTRDWSVVN
jgi:2,3-bisphosphoglycerate-dependent phosphoglycerate mutase